MSPPGDRPESVLVVVAGRGAALGDDDVATVAAAVGAAGAALGRPSWLSSARAVDLPVEDGDPRDVEAAARRALAGRPLDLAAVPREGRRKRLLVADLESTVIENEMLDELAAEVGLGERVAAITARAMNGELDFRAALAERVGLLSGLDATALERVRRRIRVDPGAATLVATMRRAGARTALVSGGFDVFAAPVAAALGFDVCRANRLEVEAGRLTGRVAEPLLDRDAKVRALEDLAAELGCGPEDAIAVGDGANDLPMLLRAGLGVAYRAKPSVAGAARFRIDHGDLATLLSFQGYRAEEWVSSAGR